MKFNLKKQKRYAPITEIGEDGLLYLTGYKRKAGSRKAGRLPAMLKQKVRCEIRDGKVHLVEKEEEIEEGMYHCAKCGWRGYAASIGTAQLAHDKAADNRKFICEQDVRPVMEGDELPENPPPSSLPPLGEHATNVRPDAVYLRMGEEKNTAQKMKVKPKAMRDYLTGKQWKRMAGQFVDETGKNVVAWIDPQGGADDAYALEDAYELAKSREEHTTALGGKEA